MHAHAEHDRLPGSAGGSVRPAGPATVAIFAALLPFHHAEPSQSGNNPRRASSSFCPGRLRCMARCHRPTPVRSCSFPAVPPRRASYLILRMFRAARKAPAISSACRAFQQRRTFLADAEAQRAHHRQQASLAWRAGWRQAARPHNATASPCQPQTSSKAGRIAPKLSSRRCASRVGPWCESWSSQWAGLVCGARLFMHGSRCWPAVPVPLR